MKPYRGRFAPSPTGFLHVGGAAPDHPLAASFPEGRYLKAVLLAPGRPGEGPGRSEKPGPDDADGGRPPPDDAEDLTSR